jgi:hypothetical protein
VRDGDPEIGAGSGGVPVRDDQLAHSGGVAEHCGGAVGDDGTDPGAEGGREVLLDLLGVGEGQFAGSVTTTVPGWGRGGG